MCIIRNNSGLFCSQQRIFPKNLTFLNYVSTRLLYVHARSNQNRERKSVRVSVCCKHEHCSCVWAFFVCAVWAKFLSEIQVAIPRSSRRFVISTEKKLMLPTVTAGVFCMCIVRKKSRLFSFTIKILTQETGNNFYGSARVLRLMFVQCTYSKKLRAKKCARERLL